MENSLSLNNRFILAPYGGDRTLRANVSSGFAHVQQKTAVVGLKVLVPASIAALGQVRIDGLSMNASIPRGSIAYIREEYLYTQPWAKNVLTSDAIEGSFIIVDATYVEFVELK